VIVLDVRDDPHVARILSEGMTGKLSGTRPLVVALAGVLLGYPHGVEAKDVVGAGEPQNRLVPAGEAARAVQSVLEVPDDPIPQREAVTLEERVEKDVEREDLTAGDVVSHLPADAAVVGEHPDAFGNDVRLLGQVGVERPASLVRLAEVVRRRGDD